MRELLVLVSAQDSTEGPWMTVNGVKSLVLSIQGLEDDGRIHLCLEMEPNVIHRVPVTATREFLDLRQAKRWRVDKQAGKVPNKTTVSARLE